MEMAYLGDIRENSISPEGIIWENDNRKDARHYWNGALVDLCDLPGEDYAKTIGAHFYGKDAMASVRIAEKFFAK